MTTSVDTSIVIESIMFFFTIDGKRKKKLALVKEIVKIQDSENSNEVSVVKQDIRLIVAVRGEEVGVRGRVGRGGSGEGSVVTGLRCVWR